ncbi:hypothetical protein BVRB_2g034150 [Beta vulgaris subsp. vulgaris]|nr:hypothetical protein BVRB_2g034150 [Beta vulgaris subsp. vulgaris]
MKQHMQMDHFCDHVARRNLEEQMKNYKKHHPKWIFMYKVANRYPEHRTSNLTPQFPNVHSIYCKNIVNYSLLIYSKS